MAEGESMSNWPNSVSFNDNDPDDGYASIYLGVPGLKVKEHGLLPIFRKQETNVAIVSNFKNNIIEVKISFTEPGNSTVYEYKKKVPAGGIDSEKCDVLVNGKTGKIIIKLKKEKIVPWAKEERYLIAKP